MPACTTGQDLNTPAGGNSPHRLARAVTMKLSAIVLLLVLLPPGTCHPLTRRACYPDPAPDPNSLFSTASLVLPSQDRGQQPKCPSTAAEPSFARDPTAAPRQGNNYPFKRQEGRPNSLDLTFHLLREVLVMSRAEKLAQKVLSNKMFLENIGK